MRERVVRNRFLEGFSELTGSGRGAEVRSSGTDDDGATVGNSYCNVHVLDTVTRYMIATYVGAEESVV